jgi:hypothetical protein
MWIHIPDEHIELMKRLAGESKQDWLIEKVEQQAALRSRPDIAALIQSARDEYQTDDCEIDPDAAISDGEEGDFVMAWVRVAHDRGDDERPSHDDSHGIRCASRFHGAAECTCGKAERESEEDEQEESRQIIASYADGNCPQCGEAIARSVTDGEKCGHCPFVFCLRHGNHDGIDMPENPEKTACEGCDNETPGIRPHSNGDHGHAGDPPPGFVIVEKCDTCDKYPDDLEAAKAYGTGAQWQNGNGTVQAICRPPKGTARPGDMPSPAMTLAMATGTRSANCEAANCAPQPMLLPGSATTPTTFSKSICSKTVSGHGWSTGSRSANDALVAGNTTALIQGITMHAFAITPIHIETAYQFVAEFFMNQNDKIDYSEAGPGCWNGWVRQIADAGECLEEACQRLLKADPTACAEFWYDVLEDSAAAYRAFIESRARTRGISDDELIHLFTRIVDKYLHRASNSGQAPLRPPARMSTPQAGEMIAGELQTTHMVTVSLPVGLAFEDEPMPGAQRLREILLENLKSHPVIADPAYANELADAMTVRLVSVSRGNSA